MTPYYQDDCHDLRMMLADMHDHAHGAAPKGVWILICGDDCPVRAALAASTDAIYSDSEDGGA